MVVEKARFEDWALVEMPLDSRGGWRSLKLVWAGEGGAPRKKIYWLGWNGERVSGGKDQSVLRRKKKDLFQRVQDWLRQNACPA